MYIITIYIIQDSIFLHILTIHIFQRLDIFLHSNFSYMMKNIFIQYYMSQFPYMWKKKYYLSHKITKSIKIYHTGYMLKMSHYTSDQIRSLAKSCPTLCDPMNRSTPGLPVHHQLPEFTKTHVCRVSDAIQPSHPLSSPSPPAPNPSQHQSLFQWVNSSHEVAKVLKFQL